MALSNLFLGFRAGAGAQALAVENASAIGSYSYTTGDDQLSLGSDAVQEIRLFGLSFLRSNTSLLTCFAGSGLPGQLSTGQNLGIGFEAGNNLSTGERNVALGYLALNALTSGSNNVGVGDFALAASTNAIDCTAAGSRALGSHTAGEANTAIGKYTLHSGQGDGFNTLVGDSPLRFGTTASENAVVGYRAAEQTETGSRNTITGTGAWLDKLQGDENVALGYATAWAVASTAHRNVAVGSQALRSLAGDDNVALGASALFSFITTGCTAIGARAGYGFADGFDTVIVGCDAGTGSAQNVSAANSLVVGYEAISTASNQVVLGNVDTTESHLAGQVGIGRGHASTRGVLDVSADGASDIPLIETTGAVADEQIAVAALVASHDDPGEAGFGPALALAIGGTDAVADPFAAIGATILSGPTTGRIKLMPCMAGVPHEGAWIEPACLRIGPTTAIPAGGNAAFGMKYSDQANFGIFAGSGAPSLSASQGSLYLRTDGSGTSDRAYLNVDGSTGWVALQTAS